MSRASLAKLTKDISNFDIWIRFFSIQIAITSKYAGLATSPMYAVIADKKWPPNPVASDPDTWNSKLLNFAMLHSSFPKPNPSDKESRSHSEQVAKFLTAIDNAMQIDFYNHLLFSCDDHLVNIVTQQVEQDDHQSGTKAFVIIHSLCAVNNEVTQAADSDSSHLLRIVCPSK